METGARVKWGLASHLNVATPPADIKPTATRSWKQSEFQPAVELFDLGVVGFVPLLNVRALRPSGYTLGKPKARPDGTERYFLDRQPSKSAVFFAPQEVSALQRAALLVGKKLGSAEQKNCNEIACRG